MKELIKKAIIQILTWEARVTLWKHKSKIVAITGVVGKTGTKDAVAQALSTKYSVRKSQKSFNSEFGIPLTILGLENAWNNPILWIKNIVFGFIQIFIGDYEDVLVLEVGADKPGDIANVANWLKSDIVIITAIPEVPVHREFYPDFEAVLKEKSALVKSLKKDGLLITGDDERVSTITHNGRVIRVSIPISEVMYEDGLPVGIGFNIDNNKVYIPGMLGDHQGYAIAFAISVAKEFDVNISEATDRLSALQRTPGRMNILKGKKGSLIIDDSYNSSPVALFAALKTLGSLDIKGKKIAILGDMNELGDVSDREHRKAGVRSAHVVDHLYTLGVKSKILAQEAIEEGLSTDVVESYDYDQFKDLTKRVLDNINKGDVILIKGSQGGVRLERVVKELMQESDKADKLLVRQEKQWLIR